MNKVFITLLALFIFTNAYASDVAKEKRWAEQVVDALIDGEEIWLKTADKSKHEFLGIYTEAASESHDAAIIMHGSGVHPDWQQVVQPLRVDLTEHGWNTLSIQMPILPNEAEHHEYAPLFEEVSPRITAAIKQLKSTGNSRIVIVSHSLGSAMAAYHLSKSSADISGFAGIGMSASSKDKRMNQSHSLTHIKIPVLDLYGEDDLEEVLKTIKYRAAAATNSGNKHYTQIKTNGANHFFDGKENELVTTVAKWLKQFKN